VLENGELIGRVPVNMVVRRGGGARDTETRSS